MEFLVIYLWWLGGVWDLGFVFQIVENDSLRKGGCVGGQNVNQQKVELIVWQEWLLDLFRLVFSYCVVCGFFNWLFILVLYLVVFLLSGFLGLQILGESVQCRFCMLFFVFCFQQCCRRKVEIVGVEGFICGIVVGCCQDVVFRDRGGGLVFWLGGCICLWVFVVVRFVCLIWWGMEVVFIFGCFCLLLEVGKGRRCLCVMV